MLIQACLPYLGRGEKKDSETRYVVCERQLALSCAICLDIEASTARGVLTLNRLRGSLVLPSGVVWVTRDRRLLRGDEVRGDGCLMLGVTAVTHVDSSRIFRFHPMMSFCLLLLEERRSVRLLGHVSPDYTESMPLSIL